MKMTIILQFYFVQTSRGVATYTTFRFYRPMFSDGRLQGVSYTLSSLKISVKNPGSLLMRSILELSRLTISRHRSQNLSLLSSTRNGFKGQLISFPMQLQLKYRHVRTVACSSRSDASSPSTSSRTSMYTNTTFAGFMNATS